MRFNNKPKTKFMDVETKLAHFALITFYIDPQIIRPMIDERFDLNLIEGPDGEQKALLSIVPFLDQDFCFKTIPWIKFEFGQTNYRVYVKDKSTGEDVVWFLGTTLGSYWNFIPKYFWKLPWHYGHFNFDCEWDTDQNKYKKYKCSTKSVWADAQFELQDSGRCIQELNGFDCFDEGHYLLTHPMIGYYYKSDGKLGTYHIWHDKLELNEGILVSGRFDLLESLGLWEGSLGKVHSVMIHPEAKFTIYLPPK